MSLKIVFFENYEEETLLEQARIECTVTCRVIVKGLEMEARIPKAYPFNFTREYKLDLSKVGCFVDADEFTPLSCVHSFKPLIMLSFMKQRADSEIEVESWLKQLSGALEVHQRWMREHFARLVRLDLGLAITQPAAASVTTRLKQWHLPLLVHNHRGDKG
uniref:PH domain-containing protein n=1 Tax=Echinococcus granulosus TaxID=6210 RepID=A0A068X4Y1_ECHGR|nr:hypothetical protein EgrG_002058900 [Echinococcus granulosus]